MAKSKSSKSKTACPISRSQFKEKAEYKLPVMKSVIVSRHAAAVEFVKEQTADSNMPVLASATSDDVRGNVVYGNLPLHLAALAAKVVAIEFAGAPPRGQEYGLAEMKAAGARLVEYKVSAL